MNLPEPRPQLTPRGRGLLAAAAVLLVAARLFGSTELAGLAAAAAAAIGAAVLLVGRAAMTYRAERWLAPMRVAVGEPAQARLRFTNSGSAPMAATAVASDGPGTTADARKDPCLVPPLGVGATAEACYGLPTGRRGAVAVGPLVVRVGDPLGLAERRRELIGTARLVVYPRTHTVLALPGSATRETRHGTTHPTRSPRGDDFFALREYEVGDDLRRVHWRSTARLGDLMLRQDEVRFGEVATVLLDTRASAHRGDSFEQSLEVAASVAAALVDDGRRLRFITTGGFDIELDGTRTGASHSRSEGKWAAILDHLATVEPVGAAKDSTDSFAFAVQSIRRDPSGPLAAVVGDATPAELSALGGLRSRLGPVLIAQTQTQAGNGGAANAEAVRSVPGAVLVPVHHIDDFPKVWNQAVVSCGRRDTVSR
ncbi:MAG: DUF58 domain-containing protein [Actinobacteria bacterium]|nr:DUF58 domain-containing protein [Actinomycetota bacterium]